MSYELTADLWDCVPDQLMSVWVLHGASHTFPLSLHDPFCMGSLNSICDSEESTGQTPQMCDPLTRRFLLLLEPVNSSFSIKTKTVKLKN